jgi:predicted SAM-dependent methyltransferase
MVSPPLASKMLNLGCGGRFHEAWINLDYAPQDRRVLRHDLREPLPFADESFETIYHSHVLEHLRRDRGRALILECFRVLEPGGILRIAVPDLEKIARLYLQYLSGALEGEAGASERYEWITLELMDQMVRDSSGGQMGEYWKQHPMPAEAFVLERMGHEVKQTLARLRSSPAEARTQSSSQKKPLSPDEIGRFREGGEVHKWMYDRYSLAKLLREEGFAEVELCSPTTSRIAHFSEYRLDMDEDGMVRKPDSLFMEAIKPGRS